MPNSMLLIVTRSLRQYYPYQPQRYEFDGE